MGETRAVRPMVRVFGSTGGFESTTETEAQEEKGQKGC
jgi:hypothetical protein